MINCRFINFVKKAHSGQKRKCIDKPYFEHVYNVYLAVLQEPDFPEFVQYIALGHDLLEGTDITEEKLHKVLAKCLKKPEIELVINGIKDLTNHFTKEAFPYLNRKERKRREIQRLANLPDYLQTIKLIDRADNLLDMLAFHNYKLTNECFKLVDFLPVYIEESKQLLQKLTKATEKARNTLNEIIKLYK